MSYQIKRLNCREYGEVLRTKLNALTWSVEDVSADPDYPPFKRLCFFKGGEIVHDHPTNDRHMESALELLPIKEDWVMLEVLINFRQSLREFAAQGGWNRVPDNLAEKSDFNKFTRADYTEWMEYAIPEDIRHHGQPTFDNPLKQESEVAL